MSSEAPLELKSSARSFLFYGPPGSGKTTTAATLATQLTKGKILWLDVDEKLESMENLPADIVKRITIWKPEEAISGEHVGIVRIERQEGPTGKKQTIPGTEEYIPDNPLGYRKVVDFLNELLDRVPKGTFDYDAVVIDSLSNVVEHLVRMIQYHHKTFQFTQPLWGVYMSNIEELKSGFLRLPCVRIMIAHAKTVQDEATSEVWVRPLIAGQMADKIGKDFNEVYYFIGGSREGYKIRAHADRRHVARTTKSFTDEELISKVIKVWSS